MATNIKKAQKKSSDSVVVNKITIRPVIRQATDITDFRNKHKIAEFIINPSRVGLYDLYDETLIDAHLSGIYGKRLRALRNKKIRFVKDGVEVEEMDDLLIKKPVFRFIRKRIFDIQAWGVSGLEFIPGEKVCVKEVPRKHIKTHLKIISTEQLGVTPVEGGQYEENPFLWVKENEDEKLGFLLKAVPWVIYKRGLIGDWAQYIELFGQPVRVGKYNAYDEETRAQLEKAMESAGSSLSIMIPKEAEMQVVDGKSSNANGDLQERFKNTCDEQLSILVLGVTETTKASQSSGYAQSKTHQDEQFEVTKDDMAFEIDMLNDDKFLAILKSYGLPVDGGCFEYEDEANLSILKERLEMDIKLSDKVPVDDDYFYETYKLPKPKNYEKLKAQNASGDSKNRQPIKKDNSQNREKGAQEESLHFDEQSLWTKIRITLADFFDQPR